MLCIPYTPDRSNIWVVGSQFSHPPPLIFCLANESMIYFYYLFMFLTCAICNMYQHRARQAFRTYQVLVQVHIRASYYDADTLYYCSIKMQIKPAQSSNGKLPFCIRVVLFFGFLVRYLVEYIIKLTIGFQLKANFMIAHCLCQFMRHECLCLFEQRSLRSFKPIYS